MINLQRITTEYVEAEDRICLRGEAEDEQTTITLWLTQRLLSQVISHLLELIEKQSPDLTAKSDEDSPTSSLMQGFAQQAAQADLVPELPVQTIPSSQSWLVLEIDIALSPEGTLVLVFKREMAVPAEQNASGRAMLTIEAKQLRQWLGIVYSQWQRAGWQPGLWPSWMDEPASTEHTKSLH